MSEPKACQNSQTDTKVQPSDSSKSLSGTSKKGPPETNYNVKSPKASHDNSPKWESRLNIKNNDSPLHKLNAHLVKKNKDREAKPN